ncbi:hypothetical protein [Cryptosporangium sp. NPDC051539]|uniref:hypothetical protein n=1 Tax=Cryptosporangium sp. NPDC051539 TaxID=3363962 RepID=UPI0037B97338
MTLIEAVNNFGDTREGASAGPLALAVIAVLAIATVLLWRNMTARIKRLPAEFPPVPGEGAAAATKAESVATATPKAGTTVTDADAAPAADAGTEKSGETDR